MIKKVFLAFLFVFIIGCSNPSDLLQKIPLSDIDFQNIRLNMIDMTEVQWKDYASSLIGKKIKWEGWVEEVKETSSNFYEVLIDMDSPDITLSVQDVTFEIDKTSALSLIKNKKIEFEGMVVSVDNVLQTTQVSLNTVVITSTDVYRVPFSYEVLDYNSIRSSIDILISPNDVNNLTLESIKRLWRTECSDESKTLGWCYIHIFSDKRAYTLTETKEVKNMSQEEKELLKNNWVTSGYYGGSYSYKLDGIFELTLEYINKSTVFYPGINIINNII